MMRSFKALIGVMAWGLACAAGSGLAQELFTGDAGLPNQVERMYVKGLQFLSSTQNAQGFWDNDRHGTDEGVVGLAAVAFLAHGDDPNHGPYSQTIKKSLSYILNRQDNKGYIGNTMYNHGFATLALAEAYGAVLDERLGPALEKAVELIVSAQERNPLKAWRYSPESQDADTTVTGAQLVALFAARNAGVGVPEEAIQNGMKFMLSCQTEQGGIGYLSSSGPNAARTAIGCVALALAKEKNSEAFKNAFDYLKQAPEQRSYQRYFQYYASQAFFHASPQGWKEWNRNNIQLLLDSQNSDGSWDGQFGQTFSTSACLLSLALNYRFLPIYER